ncbi:MAG: hypothetical protein IH609_19495, partial [Dehalococcoidia bacterium]|nr:hypothetical protein [Dehalococcoidia bacterium]
GTFKHGAGRMILLALGGTVVAAAVVTAVAVRQSPESNSLSGVSAQVNSPLYPASREGVRGHVDIDPPLVAAGESVRSTSRLPNYPASREGVRGHVDIDPPLVAASESARSTSRLPNYPASREGVRGHVTSD